jgi:sortase A
MMMRQVLRALSTILIASGVLLIADAAATVTWQEPLSAFLGRVQQDKLSGQLKRLERSAPSPVEAKVLRALPDERRRLAFLARSLKRHAADGQAVGRIKIPRIGASFVVVKGTDTGDLRKGPGAYPQTPLPGAPGTVAIAGHRTTYGAPFRHIDRLAKGNTITVTMPYGRFTYRVENRRIVGPNAIWVINRVGYNRLVLSACHPLYSAAKRIVVFARLVETQPLGAAAKFPAKDSSAAA